MNRCKYCDCELGEPYEIKEYRSGDYCSFVCRSRDEELTKKAEVSDD